MAIRKSLKKPSSKSRTRAKNPARQEQEMRADLTRKTAFIATIEPADRIHLPGPRPSGKTKLDVDTLRRTNGAIRHPALDMINGKR